MSVKTVKIQEQIEELGYSSVQEAIDNGVEIRYV